ncbi:MULTISPECIES: response regulator [Pseudomonas]|jgi:two-component system capsular synthesis response regulator RcsB|uniref:Transcriptional regulatory protein RcsB n=1 Tax=Pseudomonas fluorescens TaxID=294 RepID=A0A5E7I8L4_PSEFL|nr:MULTISPECIES: response regulator [Pseudomonas]KPG97831.1 LuxR family transcriptional regulator [Pseudomonas sp. RIT-PI-r]MCP1489021.1 two-component system capsular synthesis response regulator RcsB [Pseudomonas fluorescens]PRB49989.1 DNA-binding response regulator [Pseudomonas sp. MYb3]PRC36627.1 DNA-binding response regulator [Pseudomonas sp. MYb2]VVO72002.1 Transcriptional regulatory protein RcsB [Pseudomonas fluorescens]
METFNVVIADDHPIVLLGVRELVERDQRFRVVGEAVGSDELIKLLETKPVDLLITDFNMPAASPYGDGLKLVEYLIRHFPKVRVLVLTMISNPLILTRLQELGVLAVIQKNQLHDEIETALRAIAKGNPVRWQAPAPTSVVNDGADLDERFSRLSPKEHEILRLFVQGQGVNDIARHLNRSAKTISTQKISAMRKLDVSSDQELLTYCIERNLFN